LSLYKSFIDLYFPGPDTRGYETLSDNQSYQTFAVPKGDTLSSAEYVNIGDCSRLDEYESFDESSYDTSYASITSQDNFTDLTNSNDCVVPHTDPSTSLSGIGHCRYWGGPFSFYGLSHGFPLRRRSLSKLMLISRYQGVNDKSSSESSWTTWHNPNVLLQHASKFKVAPLVMKPHVEEAMTRFRVSFYDARGTAEEHYDMVESR
jgi:hypothetical protein